MDLGANIDYYRKKRRMTKVELASRAEMSKGNLSDIISGKVKSPSFHTVVKLAKILEVSLDELNPNKSNEEAI